MDPGNAGVVEVQTIHNLLSGNFGVDKVTQRSAGVIERVIKKILERCGENAGIKGLQRYAFCKIGAFNWFKMYFILDIAVLF